MSTSGSSGSIPFRSKKRIMDSPGPKSQLRNPKPPSMGLPTPEKPAENVRSRTRNRGVALSVKEIRQAAQSCRRSEDPTVETISAGNKLAFDSSSSPCKPKSVEKKKLPEKYENLGEFFDGLDSAIRLSKLKGSMPTFSNVSAKIEYLSERRFLYSHLAQLKHILPEAIEIKRVLMFDERTSCMKPDLHVGLNVNAIEYDERSKSESKNISLRKVFRTRLADFVRAHPEGAEIPEEPLPEPFNRKKQNNHSNGELVSSPLLDAHSASSEEQKGAVASRLSRSPQRSYKISSNEKTVSAYALSREKLSSDLSSDEKPQSFNSAVKQPFSDPTATLLRVTSPIEEMAETPAKPTSSRVKAISTPVKAVSTPAIVASDPVASTPAKVASTPVKVASTPPELTSTPARLISASLAAQARKRSGHTRPDDNLAVPPNKLVRRPTQTLRSLNFDTFTEDEKAMEVTDDGISDEILEEGASSDDDTLGILPETLLQSIREQEKKIMEDQDPAISQAKRRRKMIACLPKLFNVIHFLFQSIRRSVITKEELMHKIIAGHSDIIDRREVEEQLNLMLELVPEWISEKRSFSGDLLICVNKMSSPETIRSRLEEENRQCTAPVS